MRLRVEAEKLCEAQERLSPSCGCHAEKVLAMRRCSLHTAPEHATYLLHTVVAAYPVTAMIA